VGRRKKLRKTFKGKKGWGVGCERLVTEWEGTSKTENNGGSKAEEGEI